MAASGAGAADRGMDGAHQPTSAEWCWNARSCRSARDLQAYLLEHRRVVREHEVGADPMDRGHRIAVARLCGIRGLRRTDDSAIRVGVLQHSLLNSDLICEIEPE
jgi:hypothetical protein